MRPDRRPRPPILARCQTPALSRSSLPPGPVPTVRPIDSIRPRRQERHYSGVSFTQAQFAGERAGALYRGVGDQRDDVHAALWVRKTEPPKDLDAELGEQFIDFIHRGYVPFHDDGYSTEPLFHGKFSREADVVSNEADSLPCGIRVVNGDLDDLCPARSRGDSPGRDCYARHRVRWAWSGGVRISARRCDHRSPRCPKSRSMP